MPTPLKWIIGILTPIVLILCLLCFGNPQWGKWVYMWQAYVLPQEEGSSMWAYDGLHGKLFLYSSFDIPEVKVGHLSCSNNFSGTWKVWSDYGDLISTTEMSNGLCKGIQVEYANDGRVLILCHWDEKRKRSVIAQEHSVYGNPKAYKRYLNLLREHPPLLKIYKAKLHSIVRFSVSEIDELVDVKADAEGDLATGVGE
jgi:hypothetical protein